MVVFVYVQIRNRTLELSMHICILHTSSSLTMLVAVNGRYASYHIVTVVTRLVLYEQAHRGNIPSGRHNYLMIVNLTNIVKQVMDVLRLWYA